MKRLFLIVGLAWAVFAAVVVGQAPVAAQNSAAGSALTPWEEVQALPSRVDGICQVYPSPSGVLTPAPKGYKAFYLSHYGRHGSRLSHREDYYTDPLHMLLAADSAGVLTPLGESVLSRLERQYDEAKGRIGELTYVGVREHRGIAERMVRRFPSVFRKGAIVDSRSTESPRVILSMAANNERLRELCPGLRLIRSASDTYTGLGVSYPMVGRDSILRRCHEIIELGFDRTGFSEKLFTDIDYADGLPYLNLAAWHLYYTASNLGCVDHWGFDYSDVLPLDQMYVFWEATNYLLYSSCSNAPFNSSEVMRCAQLMLTDILSRADAALAGVAPEEKEFIAGGVSGESAFAAGGATGDDAESGGAFRLNAGTVGGFGMNGGRGTPVHAADLRFGHDVYLIPLAALLGLSGQYYADPYTTKDVWRYYHVSPMAGNIQLVFYAPKKALRRRARALKAGIGQPEISQKTPRGPAALSEGVVLVKVLLNEEEMLLQTPEGHDLPPAPQPVSGPYYSWHDLRAWLAQLASWAF